MRLQLLGAKKTVDFDDSMASAQRKAFKPAQDQQEEEEEPRVDEQAEETKVEEPTAVAEVEEEEPETPKDEELGGGDDEEEEEEEAGGNEDEEKKEIDQLMKEEDINLVPEDVDLNEIDKLTGIPKSNDIILALVPMCAPYTAI
jgi:hypothetical protein